MSASLVRDRPILTLGLALSLVIVGCTKDPIDTAQTVDYYRSHGKERQALLVTCANDPGRLGNKPACINAQQAELREGIGSFKDLPPMGLSGTGTAPSTTETPPKPEGSTPSRSN